ncbi:MAG: ATP-binding cassette domain-containing protein [Gammaproteobacteria bacterium]|jgi:phospholipid/cholesterol/gamma-HCH transport system ATP-binding protein|nr:ATP-binding cassette domain-containing protein [Gammaproteobacteria bacterium]
MSKTNVVEVSNLHFARGTRSIFSGLNIGIKRGCVTAVMGPSGCGKTTLLRLIGGQLIPQQGQVKVFDQVLHSLNREQLTQLRARMGVLFQSGALFTDLNVFENVAFPLREHGSMTADELHDKVLLRLEAVGLRGARYLMPAELSGGMARRVALARAIAMEPELVLYDEPFAGQDPIALAVLQRLIRALNDSLQMTSVLISHDIVEACAIADEVILLGGAGVLAQGSPEALLKSTDPMVYQFMHGQADGAVPFHYPAPELITEMRTATARSHIQTSVMTDHQELK